MVNFWLLGKQRRWSSDGLKKVRFEDVIVFWLVTKVEVRCLEVNFFVVFWIVVIVLQIQEVGRGLLVSFRYWQWGCWVLQCFQFIRKVVLSLFRIYGGQDRRVIVYFFSVCLKFQIFIWIFVVELVLFFRGSVGYLRMVCIYIF